MDFPLLALLMLVVCYFVFAFAVWSKHRAEHGGENHSDQIAGSDDVRGVDDRKTHNG